jgi:hypothetical protein
LGCFSVSCLPCVSSLLRFLILILI